jgi:hypothetical protein
MIKYLFTCMLISFNAINIHAQNAPCISIIQPVNGAHVPQSNNTIDISICQNIPMGNRLVVFIQDPTGQWWPYINASQNTSPRAWRLRHVQYGNQDDSGSTFNIQVLIINNNLVTNATVVNNTPLSASNYSSLKSKLGGNETSSIISVIRQ